MRVHAHICDICDTILWTCTSLESLQKVAIIHSIALNIVGKKLYGHIYDGHHLLPKKDLDLWRSSTFLHSITLQNTILSVESKAKSMKQVTVGRRYLKQYFSTLLKMFGHHLIQLAYGSSCCNEVYSASENLRNI